MHFVSRCFYILFIFSYLLSYDKQKIYLLHDLLIDVGYKTSFVLGPHEQKRQFFK